MNIDKELVKYILNGGLTTGVNYVVYFTLMHLHMHYLLANSIAWLVAVLVAFYTNRRWVFKSSEAPTKQFVSFVSLRASTLLVENGLLYIFIQLFAFASLPAKIAVSIFTIIANYAICKTKIFIKG